MIFISVANHFVSMTIFEFIIVSLAILFCIGLAWNLVDEIITDWRKKRA